MAKPILEVVENDLKHTNEDLEEFKLVVYKEIALLKIKNKDLEDWKLNCTKWAMWWAGVCAALMSMATFIQTYWDKIQHYIVSR